MSRPAARLNRYPAGATCTLERISGHRDGDATSCPGDGLYAQLPARRTMVPGPVQPRPGCSWRLLAEITFRPKARSPDSLTRRRRAPPVGTRGRASARWRSRRVEDPRDDRDRAGARAVHPTCACVQPRAAGRFRGIPASAPRNPSRSRGRAPAARGCARPHAGAREADAPVVSRRACGRTSGSRSCSSIESGRLELSPYAKRPRARPSGARCSAAYSSGAGRLPLCASVSRGRSEPRRPLEADPAHRSLAH